MTTDTVNSGAPRGLAPRTRTAIEFVLDNLVWIILIVVLAALWLALFGRPETKARLGGTKVIWIAGIAFPIVVLTALLVYGLTLTRHLSAPITGQEMRVRVSGVLLSLVSSAARRGGGEAAARRLQQSRQALRAAQEV